MLNTIGRPLIGYMAAQTADPTSTDDPATAKSAVTTAKGQTPASMQAAIQREAVKTKAAAATHALDTSQKALSSDLRAAMDKAGVKLAGTVDFSVSSEGAVQTKAADADKAAVKAFLNADTSHPSFATRIANQAQDALKLSSSIQQGAAISQAATYAKSSSGVVALYSSMMQRASGANVVFSVSAESSSLSYPGSLAADA